uniref:Uncharacterized protein n=1 Tax=Rhizophora mucronata TaxID=61149 RepID=A0A2P2QQ20_RHIMU
MVGQHNMCMKPNFEARKKMLRTEGKEWIYAINPRWKLLTMYKFSGSY